MDSHANWQRAASVQNGEQPHADPDAPDLLEFDDSVRRYREGLCKRLIDGRWIAAIESDTA